MRSAPPPTASRLDLLDVARPLLRVAVDDDRQLLLGHHGQLGLRSSVSSSCMHARDAFGLVQLVRRQMSQRLMWLSRPRRCAFDLAALVEQRAEGAEQLEVYEVGVTVRAQVRSCCARPPCLSARCPTPLSEFRNRLTASCEAITDFYDSDPYWCNFLPAILYDIIYV